MKPLNLRKTLCPVRSFLARIHALDTGKLVETDIWQIICDNNVEDWIRAAWLIILLVREVAQDGRIVVVLSDPFIKFLKSDTIETVSVVFGILPLPVDLDATILLVKATVGELDFSVYLSIAPSIPRTAKELNPSELLQFLSDRQHKIVDMGTSLDFECDCCAVSMTWTSRSIFPKDVYPNEALPRHIYLRRKMSNIFPWFRASRRRE